MASHFRVNKIPILANTATSSTTAYTSAVTHILNLDNVFAQINFTGTPTGTLTIQVSADYFQDQQGNVISTGNWVTIVTQPVSGAQVFGFDLNQLGAPWLRIVYTNASSTGHVAMFLSGKGLQ